MKKIIITFIAIIFIFSSILLIPPSKASQPCSVRGYFYLNDISITPDQIKLELDTQELIADLYPDGYYTIDFDADPGDTGIFNITIGSNHYIADETILIESGVILYSIDLHVYIQNNAPVKPVDPIPENNSVNISIYPALSVFVSDPDGDELLVKFYNATSHALIDQTTVNSNTRAEITYDNLDYETEYFWYATVNDSIYENKSETFSFTTKNQENNAPELEIITPKPFSFYLFGKKYFENFPFNTLIIGDIQIQVETYDNDSGIEKVEFYICDWLNPTGKEIGNVTEAPYKMNWTRSRFSLSFKNTIKVIAYDFEGAQTQKEIEVFRFL